MRGEWGTFVNYGNNCAEREGQKNLEEQKIQQYYFAEKPRANFPVQLMRPPLQFSGNSDESIGWPHA